MQVRIVAVGRLKAGPERDLVARYLDRLQKAGRSLGITQVEIVEVPESRAGTGALRREQEGEAIRRALAKAETWFVLDERGKDQPSDRFATSLRGLLETSVGVTGFVIGGADGLAPELRKDAAAALCFGKMTWPHQMVRIMLCEQLYRAVTILSGHPYHRGG